MSVEIVQHDLNDFWIWIVYIDQIFHHVCEVNFSASTTQFYISIYRQLSNAEKNINIFATPVRNGD